MGNKTNQIATQLEAKTIGGGNINITNNKCVTKASAIALLCEVDSSKINYTDNQLVRYQDLSSTNVVRIYLGDTSSLSNFDGRITVNIINNTKKKTTILTSSSPVACNAGDNISIEIVPTGNLSTGKYYVSKYDVVGKNNLNSVTSNSSFTMPGYDCMLNLLSGQKYTAKNLTYIFDDKITLFSETPYHISQQKTTGNTDQIIYKDNFTISGSLVDFYKIKSCIYQYGSKKLTYAINIDENFDYSKTFQAYDANQSITLSSAPQNEDLHLRNESELCIISIGNSTAQRHLSLTCPETTSETFVRTPDNTYRQTLNFASMNTYENREFAVPEASRYDFTSTCLDRANNGPENLPCVYTDMPNIAYITFAVPITNFDSELSSISIYPCCWSNESSSFVVKNSENGIPDSGIIFEDIINNPSQTHSMNDGSYCGLSCDFDETPMYVICKYYYVDTNIIKTMSQESFDTLNNDQDSSKNVINLFGIQMTYGSSTTNAYCVLYKYLQDKYNPFDSCEIIPIDNYKYINGYFDVSKLQQIHDIPCIYQDLGTSTRYTHLLDGAPSGSNYVDFDANVGIYQFGRLVMDVQNLQNDFSYQTDDYMWGFKIYVPQINEDIGDIIINLRLGNFNKLGDYNMRYELLDWNDTANGDGFFDDSSASYNGCSAFTTGGIVNLNLKSFCDEWYCDEPNECLSIHFNSDENCYYVVFNITGMYRKGLIYDSVYEHLISTQNDYYSLLFTCSSGGRTWACMNHLLPEVLLQNNIDGVLRPISSLLNTYAQLNIGSNFSEDIEVKTMNDEIAFNGSLFVEAN